MQEQSAATVTDQVHQLYNLPNDNSSKDTGDTQVTQSQSEQISHQDLPSNPSRDQNRNFSDKISPFKQNTHKKMYSSSQDKENTNQTQENYQLKEVSMQKSTSLNFKDQEKDCSDYQEIENENNMSNMNSMIQGQIRKKNQKYSASKETKILQTMKAYFPGLNNLKEKKKRIFPSAMPPKHSELIQNRSETQGSMSSMPSKSHAHNERIIFVDDSRKQNKQAKARHQSIERRNSNSFKQPNPIPQNVNLSNQVSYRKNITQLPPIEKKQNVDVLDQDSPKQKNIILSPQSNLEPPVTDSQQTFPSQKLKKLNKHMNGLQTWSDQKSRSFKQDQQYILLPDNVEQAESEQQKQANRQRQIDFERKNQERIQKMQEKKAQEQKLIEEERQKMIKKQEKLKNMILKQAAEHREKREKDRLEQPSQQLQQPTKKTPVKRKAESVPIPGEEDEKEKEKYDMMKKYYRNRYTSFLRTLQEQKKKKEQEMEELKTKEEKKKAKLKDQIGMKNIQSKFMEDVTKLTQQVESAKEKAIAEAAITRTEKKQYRGRSTVVFKGFSSSTSFNHQPKNDTAQDLIKAYQQPLVRKERSRSRSKSVKRTLTPKLKTKKMIPLENPVVNEKDEEELQKELKAKREAAERIKQRQQKYIEEMKEKKEKDQHKLEEERKRKEKIKQMAREQAKQNFEQFQNRPGLKEQQEMSEKQKDEGDEDEEDGQKKKKKKPKLESGIEAFIERNNPKRTGFPNITDMALWKKKFKVDDQTKVFICTGGYPDIKKALKKRGWVHNKDPNSPCFDLKWVLRAKDIDHNTLNDNQLVNHFNKAAAITTKVGLCHNLKNLIWFNNVDIDTFYPRCFDLAIQDELDDFIQEFKAVKAESYIKTYIRELRDSQGEKTTVTPQVIKVALRVCEKRLKDLDDLIDDPNAFSQLVTDEEWRVLGADELNVQTLAQKKHEEWLARYEIMEKKKERDAKKKQKKKKKSQKVVVGEEEKKDEEILAQDNEEEEEDEEELDLDNQIAQKYPEFKRAVRILDELKNKYPQCNLNGENNIWIIKPAGSSRGRGIVLYKQLVEILDLCKQKESQFIAQKYIENQLIMKNRKFDIRQWVLVTDWNPLTIWLYQEPYVRFPACDYNADNIMDKFIHLTNNSIGKYQDQPQKTAFDIPGNMWSHEEFQTYLFEEYGSDVWEDKLKEQVKNIIINSLESVQDMFEYKAGCFELFGYDLMMDDELNMWLIEVNSSPAMDYSTHVTSRLVKMVLEDCVKVVVDHASAKKKKQVDTGLFECIYKAKRMVDKPMQSFGLNLVCEGKKIANNKLQHY